MSAGTLQVLLVKHGRWLDQDEAEDLAAQVRRGDLPQDRFVEEALARSRPLTLDERRKLVAAGILERAE